MFDLGAQELIVIFIVAFLVFGPKRLPELGKTLGKGIRELKAAMRNIKETLEESDLDVSKEIRDAKAGIEKSIYKAIEPETVKKDEAAEKKKAEDGPDEKMNTAAVEEKKAKSETDRNG